MKFNTKFHLWTRILMAKNVPIAFRDLRTSNYYMTIEVEGTEEVTTQWCVDLESDKRGEISRKKRERKKRIHHQERNMSKWSEYSATTLNVTEINQRKQMQRAV